MLKRWKKVKTLSAVAIMISKTLVGSKKSTLTTASDLVRFVIASLSASKKLSLRSRHRASLSKITPLLKLLRRKGLL